MLLIASAMSRERTSSKPCALSACITFLRTSASCAPSNLGTPIRLPAAWARPGASEESRDSDESSESKKTKERVSRDARAEAPLIARPP